MSKNTDKTTLENSVSKNNKTIKNTGNKITMSNEKSNPTTTSKKVSKTPKLANFKPVSEADLAKNKNIIEIMAEEKTTKKKISPKTPEKSTGKTPEKLSQEIDPEKLGKKEVMNENLSESKIPEKFSENEKIQNILVEIEKAKENKPKPKNFNTQIILNIVSLVLMLVILGIFFSGNSPKEEQVQNKNTFSSLITLIRQGKVSEIELLENKTKFAVKIYEIPEEVKNEVATNPEIIKQNPDKYLNRDKVKTEIFPTVDSGFGSSPLETIKTSLGEDVKIGTGTGEVIYKQREPSWYSNVLSNEWLPTLFFVGITAVIGLFLVRKLTDANNRSISFGNTRSKFYDENNKKKITFADVAGNEEAKTELLEVVDFLKRPAEYNKMGAKIPKGVLLVGTPGNGKTLMARAIAGEAEVPFMYVSGSEFVEMFVGVGASRVRDLFKQAKAKAPCVIFIDEIDAVGRQRGAGVGGGNDEREQTLNQILVELDGFESTDYVILIGATNRPDVLDPALLRPGRFDRQVTVTSPDRKEREAILKIHAKGKNFAPDVDLSIIAKRTAGFSGADLMNVLNEAAILAVREKSPQITNLHVREGVEKAILGSSLVSKVITEEQKKLTAYHEAGHAIIQTVLPGCNKVQKITIIPRGRAAGYTFAAEGENDAITRKKSQFLADITSLFGGYVAEEIIFGEVSTGASNDLEKATQIARNMATRYGMTTLGPISFEEGKGMSFLGKDMMDKPNYSEDSARKIDTEVSIILQKCYTECRQILEKNLKDLHRLAEYLIEKEVIEYEEFEQIVGHLLPKKA